ncbi:MAG: hypothetical protein ACE5GA_00955 [Candidatus Zixiibacteriota bacterium]
MVTVNAKFQALALSVLISCCGMGVWVFEDAAAQIVNNSSAGETSEDSLTVAALSLDSLGNPFAADSFYVVVFSGGKANSFVFADSGTTALVGLDTVRVGGQTLYYYSRKISDIDGAGSPGVYSGLVMAKSNSLGLRTVSRFSFQVVGWELDNMGDSSGLAALAASAARDTLDAGFGSLSAVTVGSISAGAVTDAAIADQAIDIDEFAGTYAGGQFEAGVFTGPLMSDSWKIALWGADTALVNVGFAKTIKDSALVRGGVVDSNRTEQGGSGDSASVARWVWNTPSGNHSNAATFGDYLDARVSLASAGRGAYSVTLVALDSSSSQMVPGATAAVFNVSQTSLLAIGATDNSGEASFNLDADSFVVTVTLRGHVFPAYDTLLISGAQTDTVFGYRFDPGAPPAPELVRAWGFVLDVAGAPDSGAVASAFLPAGVAQAGGAIVAPFAVSALTDSAGYFALDLIPNSLMLPDTTRYEFTIFHSNGTVLRKRLVAPDSASWRITW